MIDWTESMQQYYEYYTVSPITWADVSLINTVTTGSITNDLNTETLTNATFAGVDMNGEFYIRAYICAKQGDEFERRCLGTFLVQSPSCSYDGKYNEVSALSYSPLIELKENYPPMFYTLPKETDVVEWAYNMIEENSRLKVDRTYKEQIISKYDYVANADDNWLDFITSVLNQNGVSYKLSPEGVVSLYKTLNYNISPIKYIFKNDEKSIILPRVSYSKDMYDIPNVVEVYVSTEKGYNVVRVSNNLSANDSATSIDARGREIVHRETSPSIVGIPTDAEIENYAKMLLESLSTIVVELSFTHAYVPGISVGDTILVDYPEAGLNEQRCKITSQQMDLSEGLLVDTTATFEIEYWR